MVWTATEEDIGLPITVVDVLDAARAREVAALTLGAQHLPAAHAAACALARGWPVVTAEPSRYFAVEGLVVEELP
jgi:predicted nucleic acid-binding protein